jgi:RNA polymerase sigma factor (sigma-70 family)
VTEAPLAVLRRLLLDRYDDLKRSLTRRLGSSEMAGDVLHDTWLRLARADTTIGTLHNPGSYLLRILFNVAQDHRRAEKHHLTKVDIERLLHIADEAPGPARIAEARSDLGAMAAILAELPPRRRAILLAARVDNMARQEIADRLGVSLRLVSKELQLAHEYCLARQKEMRAAECTTDRKNSSLDQDRLPLRGGHHRDQSSE